MNWLWMAGLVVAGAVLAGPAWAQDNPYTLNQQVARLSADVQRLQQQLGSLNIAVEELQRENASLKQELARQNNTSQENYVTMAQLTRAISELRNQMVAANETQKAAIIREVGVELDGIIAQVNKLLERGQVGARPSAPSSPPPKVDFPKTGVGYTVKAGDSLGKIAREQKSRIDWIRSANNLASDVIYPGQELFIPQE